MVAGSSFLAADAFDAYTNKWLQDTGTGAGGGISSQMAEDQPGPGRCEGDFQGILAGTDPHWTRINVDRFGQQLYADNTHPGTPIVKAEGQILNPSTASAPLPPDIEPSRRTNSWVNFTDLTIDHWSRDFNIFLTLDRQYRHLQASPGQYLEGSANELGNFEIEWERGTVPPYAMPAVGDRLAVWGPHVWDCGHGDTWLEDLYPDGAEDTFRAEIHPPMGWVTYRRTADLDGNPNAGKESQVPWKWYGAGDGNGIATTLPNTPLEDTPVHATVADAYFSSFGGNIVESLNGCDSLNTPCWGDDPGERPELLLPDSYEWHQRVLDHDYEFFLPLPAKPANAPAWATPVWDVEERCGEIPPDPTFPDKLHPEASSDGGVEGGYSANKGIGPASCNPSPNGAKPYTVTPTSQNGQDGFSVTVRAKTGNDEAEGTPDDPSYPGNDYVAFAYRFKAAWDVTQPEPATTVRVEFDDLHVYNDAEPGDGCLDDGEWVMTLRANESTIYPVHGEAHPSQEDDGDNAPEPLWEDGAVDDGRCDGGDDNEKMIHNLGYKPGSPGEDNITRTVSLAPGQAVEIWDRTYDKDTLSDDTLDVVNEFLDPPPPGQTQTHYLGYVNENTPGSHEIEVDLVNITPHAIDPGGLEHTAPTYGPDPLNTGFDIQRVSGATTASIAMAEPADGVQYRIWKDGSAPGPWLAQPDLDKVNVSLGKLYAGLPSGYYRVEWAALNTTPLGTVVGQRSSAAVQVDNTPPTLAVPGDIFKEATEAGGAHVTFTVSATDNFNPQPVLDSPANPFLTCNHKSGELFPQGLNDAKTTPVTCTATDAVANAVTKTFNVHVSSPFGYVNDFVVLSTDSYVDLGRRSTVFTGNVGAYDSGDGGPHGPNGDPDIEVATGREAVLNDHSKLAGESVRLGALTKAQGVWAVDKLDAGPGATYTAYDGYVPLWLCPPRFPAFPPISGPGSDLTFSSKTGIIPGKWGHLVVKPNVTVFAVGGDYEFQSIRLMSGARLEVQKEARFFVTGPVELADDVYVGPQPGLPSPIHAVDIEMYVAGGSGGAGNPSLLARDNVEMILNVHAAGALVVGNDAKATGAYMGRSAQFGHRATLSLDSVFKADPCPNYPDDPPRPPPPCRDEAGAPVRCPPRPRCFDGDGRPLNCGPRRTALDALMLPR